MVYKQQLANGFTILLKPMSHAPVASVALFYRIGSRNEPNNATGLAHWVEHMMFKGTPTYPAGYWDQQLGRVGADWNAYTWLDYTSYYVTLPANQINLALQMEADRMCHLSLAPHEVEAERQVILSERAMYENDPNFLLDEALTAVAFQTHPYRHEILGELAHMQQTSPETLTRFYQDYYAPNNAVLVVAGQFEPDRLLAEIQQLFEPIPRGHTPSEIPQEPTPQTERRVTIEGIEDTPHLTFAYRSPQASHPDFFPLAILNTALVGGSSLGSLGSRGSNKSTRLYHALVDTELAIAVSGSLEPTIDPFLYSIQVMGQSQRPLTDIEQALEQAIRHLHQNPITADELQRAKKQAKVAYAFTGERVSGQAQALGIAEMVMGDYRWYESILDQINAVTLDDVVRVCDQYLQPHNRTVGWYQKDDI